MAGYRDLRYPYPSGGPRSSTSAVYDTAYDTRFGPSSRATIDYPPSRGRPYTTSATPRSSLEPSQATLAPYGPYPSRIRRNSSTEPSARSHLSVDPYSRPVIRTQDLQRGPPPKIYTPKEDSVVYPASSRRNHERHNSSTTEDFSRLSLAEKDRLDRQRSVHRNSYVGASRAYPAAQMARFPSEDGYSYTGPREQFDRDYPARQARPRPENYQRAERPVSMIDYGEPKGTNYARREPPPSSSVKHFERLDRGGGRRPGNHSGVGSDTERDFDRTERRREPARQPVSIHQYERDDGYSSQRDDLYERRQPRHERPGHDDDRYLSDRDNHHRHSHHDKNLKPRTERVENKDHAGMKAGLAAGLSTAIAGLALRESRDDRKDKESDYDKEPRRSEKDKRRRDRETQGEVEEYERRDKPRERTNDIRLDPDSKRGAEQPREKSDDDSAHERHRQRHRHRERAGPEAGSESGSDHRTAAASAGDATGVDDGKEHRRRHRHKHHRHRDKDQEPDHHESHVRTEIPLVDSPVEMRGEESKPRKTVTVVEPPKDEAPEFKPKGILKQPRQAFPEDPNPTREGVAPLKDADKKGVPTGARWTKINRILVNPAALEAAQERFEERDNYVIVLRVLTREEVQKLADKTKEIRETRDREERARAPEHADQQEHRKSGHGDDDYSYSESDASSSDSYLSEAEEHRRQARHSERRRESEHRDRPLTIEPPSEQTSNIFSQFMQTSSQAEQSSVPVTAANAQHHHQPASS